MVVVGTAIAEGILEATSGAVAIHQSPKRAYWLLPTFWGLAVVPLLVPFPLSRR